MHSTTQKHQTRLKRSADLVRSRNDDGFTLVELVVIILIIGLLITLAIPSFMRVRQRAADRNAQGNARTGLIAAKSHLLDGADWSTINYTLLKAAEPTLDIRYGTPGVFSSGPKEVAVTSSSSEIMIAVWSISGTCFRAYEAIGQAAATSRTTQAAAACLPGTVVAGSTW
jgi:type IV pilus assembly protein PilA